MSMESKSEHAGAQQSTALRKQAMKALKQILRAGSLKIQNVDQEPTQYLLSQGLIQKSGSILKPSSLAKQALRRFALEKEEDAVFQLQHQDRAPIKIDLKQPTFDSKEREKGQSRAAALINRAESPLSLMACRKNARGQPLLSVTQVQAGERLRADFERGQCGPNMGINWQRLGGGGLDSRSVRDHNDAEIFSYTAQEARQRWRDAVSAVGEEFAGPLIDFCCFLKGLEQIEKQRQWPSRSAKLVMSMALNALSRHYGLQEEVRGPNSNPMQHWGDNSYRPSL